ncbi:MAG: hypothetical protein OIF32_04690 [Campylobacterales bacterium]|nr:hypothetical protein [Campylobacterales bacterium]
MFILKTKIQLKNAILSVSYKGRFAIILDNNYIFYVLERKKYSLLQSKQLIKREKHFPYHKGVVIHDGLIHLTMSKSNKSALINFNKGIEKKGAFSVHNAYLDTATFSSDGEFLVTGGQDGKAFVFDTNTKNLITSLPQHTDYISSVVFSNDSEMIAASSFDFKTTIYDFGRNRISSVIKTKSVLEVLTFYDNNKKLFAIERDGVVINYDIYEQKEIFREHYFDDWPTSLVKTDDEKYVVVGTREGFIHGIRLHDSKSIFSEQRSKKGITTLTLDDDNLVIGYIDGTLEILSYNQGCEDVKNAIMDEKYEEAKKYLDNNVLLNIHPVIDEFDSSWELVKLKMQDLLKANDIKKIYSIATPFLDDQKRMEEFTAFVSKKEETIEFIKAVDHNQYIKAYAIVKDSPFLEDSDGYDKIESLWFKHFSAAKKVIYQNPTARDKVMNLLHLFKDVAIKKPAILLLMQKPEVFKKAEVLIVKKDYKGFFQWVEKHPPLKEFEIYKKVLKHGKSVIENSEKLENERNFEDAVSSLKLILDFQPLLEEIEKRLVHLGASMNFVKAVKNKELKQSYKLIEQNPEFKEFKEFLELDLIFKEKLRLAMKYAFGGIPGKIHEILGEYLDISYHSDKIASIYKIAYLNQIKRAVIKKLPVAWAGTLKKYIQLFGRDSELEHYAKEYKLGTIYQSIQEEGNPEGYKGKRLPKGILVGKK